MKPFIVGVTGGIASGKTMLCNMLLKLSAGDVTIIDADKLAHEVYAPGSPTAAKISAMFGKDIMVDGIINRRMLGQIVFQNEARMKQLTDIVWPELVVLLKERISSVQHEYFSCEEKKKNSLIIVIEAAVLLEAGWSNLVNHIILIYTENAKDIEERLKERNPDISFEDLKNRIGFQTPHSKRMQLLMDTGIPHTLIKSNQSRNRQVLEQEVLQCYTSLREAANGYR